MTNDHLLIVPCSLLIAHCSLFIAPYNLPMKKRRLARFEAAAQSFIEGTLSRFLGGRVEQAEIAALLVRALEDSHEQGDTADTFTVTLHPQDWQKIRQRHPDLEVELVVHLVQMAQQSNLVLPQRPQVRVVADEQNGRQQIRIHAERQLSPEGEQTQQFSRRAFEAGLAAQQAIQQVDAFLIVDGRTHVPLDKPLITIGRLAENDVVLDSAVVSRKHAQIRWRYGRFILYDVGSRLGTQVNEQAITECALRPGDVLLVGNIPIIYGEGSSQGKRVVRPTSTNSAAESTLLFRPVENEEESE